MIYYTLSRTKKQDLVLNFRKKMIGFMYIIYFETHTEVEKKLKGGI